jgi:hypothetical protein
MWENGGRKNPRAENGSEGRYRLVSCSLRCKARFLDSRSLSVSVKMAVNSSRESSSKKPPLVFGELEKIEISGVGRGIDRLFKNNSARLSRYSGDSTMVVRSVSASHSNPGSNRDSRKRAWRYTQRRCASKRTIKEKRPIDFSATVNLSLQATPRECE